MTWQEILKEAREAVEREANPPARWIEIDTPPLENPLKTHPNPPSAPRLVRLDDSASLTPPKSQPLPPTKPRFVSLGGTKQSDDEDGGSAK
jgi:hypothetical protein